MDYVIDNHVIKKDIRAIITFVSSMLVNGKLKDIDFKASNSNIRCTCPFHSDGLERTPSCDIYIGEDTDKIKWGTYHCFACSSKGSLSKFIGACFDNNEEYGKLFLKKYFTEKILTDNCIIDDKIFFKKISTRQKLLDEKVLDRFQSWHPYMQERKLTKEICEKFQVKYDPETQCIVFPVRDKNNNLLFLTRRNINTKQFIIDKDIKKPIYLLNYIISNNIKEIYVCESQINCLTLQSWGYPAVALFGTGDEYQYNILNNTDIICYHLCFDGDTAGYNGIKKFIKNINNSCFIDIIDIPLGKDVNDLTKTEFENLKIYDKNLWLDLHR